MTQLKVRVTSKAREAEGICSLELEASDGEALPPFRAGAHVDLYLPGGLIRQYSLFGSPSDQRRYRVAVLLEANSRGGSRTVHENVNEGDVLTISQPRNLFPLVPSERTILIAGGIGITPLMC
ncbi:ferredoxin reductase, partial [Paraburkholderia phenoliruptrix]